MVDEQASKTDNPMGSQNNVVNIDEADFAVFDALERDLASSNAGEAMRSTNTGGYRPSHDTPNDRELEKHREFTQALPDRREFERAANPPVLPPHLLQVSASHSFNSLPLNSGDIEQGHAGTMRSERVARTKSCDAQPPLRTVHQRRSDGAKRYP